MKLFIVLAVVGLSSCAKLDRTYLPPNAQTSGGSANFLQTPNFSGAANNAYSQNGNGFAQNGNSFAQADVAQNGNGLAQNTFAQNTNDFTQNRNGFAQSNAFDQDSNNFAQNQELNANSFASFEADRPERPRAALERTAAILRQDSQNDGETYAYSFETENGISAEENGVATNGVEAQGGFSYTGDDGQVYSIRYTADQNGFVPQGEHLPTSPPIPEEILKALEQNARDEAAGIFDDGSYHEGKYADSEEGTNGNMNYANQGGNYNSNGFNVNQNFGNNNFGNGNSNFAGNDDSVVTNSAASTYLPPNEDQRVEIRNQRPETPVYRQPATNGVTAAYLPPRNQAQGPSSFNGQRAPQRSSSFGQRENIRRPSFNSRDGYQY